VVYALNEPIQLREAGHETNVFYLDAYTKLVSNGIITNDTTIAEEPELVSGVVRAFVRGLDATIADPDAAFATARRAIPEMDDETAILQQAVLDESIAYWRSERPGRSDPEAWVESVALLRELGMLNAEVDPDDVYTNAFMPE
jgi:NitT/TauT family transport system substrate-binding protein